MDGAPPLRGEAEVQGVALQVGVQRPNLAPRCWAPRHCPWRAFLLALLGVWPLGALADGRGGRGARVVVSRGLGLTRLVPCCRRNDGLPCKNHLIWCEPGGFLHAAIVVAGEELSALCSRLGFPGPRMCLADAPCLNKCNDRGVCVHGFCRCLPGHFGTDCSLSLDDNGKPQILQGTSYTTRAKRPWIYVYELPPNFNAWVKRFRIDRPTFFFFWQRFLSSGARTANPDKADFFFIPVIRMECRGALAWPRLT
ncbi:hypothetical protein DUNSADRAFT_1778 [Dunaliella salina]|uniref:Epidermal growth factor-like domain-containing protein n=1 Tax=Dunaliella salina TaxID=3046 RepID=A0ABQ7GWL5_DUNSA|nr:hypothetical protein DUNSADRAFT_1778 [Dunaliella salina]|eukprot:KAF5839001.1 hypothetical protein DUNSADRAFT_1778 [Dunaliella salina]